jgi:hypothetical protein
MTVKREVGSTKDHHPIESRQHFRFTTSDVAIPELQMAAVFLTPILVQIQQQVEPPIETKVAMLIEVCVHS